MAELSTDDLRMRQFLLGELSEKDREDLEQLVLLEGGLRDRLVMAEDDLIEEYLEGSLDGDERERFLRQFLSIPHQRNKLRIAKSLRRFVRDEARFNTASMEPSDVGHAFVDTRDTQPINVPTLDTKDTLPIDLPTGPRFYHRVLTYAPIAAVLVLAAGLGTFWYVQYRSNVVRESERQAIERELAQLNASGEPDLPPDQIFTVIVPPVSSRSVVAGLSSSFKGPVFEMWLIPGTQPADKYSAVLQKVGSEDKFRVAGLFPQDRSGGKAIRLRLPTRVLTPGLYRVQLSGLSADGTVINTAEYSFEIQ